MIPEQMMGLEKVTLNVQMYFTTNHERTELHWKQGKGQRVNGMQMLWLKIRVRHIFQK